MIRKGLKRREIPGGFGFITFSCQTHVCPAGGPGLALEVPPTRVVRDGVYFPINSFTNPSAPYTVRIASMRPRLSTPTALPVSSL